MNRPLLALVALTSLAGCTGNGTTTPPSNAGAQQGGSLTRAPDQAAQQKPGASVGSPQATIPAGAKYSIVCARFGGPDHIEQGRLAKEQLVRQTGRADFHVLHEENVTELLYGYYRERDRNLDAAEASRVESDIGFLRSIKNGVGGATFPKPLVIELPTADPDGPAEYDLTRLDQNKDPLDPNRKFWTVVIAVYTADARDRDGRPLDRKKAAVEAVKEANAMKIPAFYYHGKSMSQVCIGAWPRTAIKEQEMDRASSRNEMKANSGEALVVSPAPLPQQFTDKLEARGNLQVVQPRVEILDPTLKAVLEKYKEYAVNDEVQVVTQRDPVTGKTTSKVQSSFLAEIPRPQASILTGGANANEPSPTLINPLNPNGSTSGGLRRAER